MDGWFQLAPGGPTHFHFKSAMRLCVVVFLAVAKKLIFWIASNNPIRNHHSHPTLHSPAMLFQGVHAPEATSRQNNVCHVSKEGRQTAESKICVALWGFLSLTKCKKQNQATSSNMILILISMLITIITTTIMLISNQSLLTTILIVIKSVNRKQEIKA